MCCPHRSAQAAYPERTVTIVTPFAPGGIADVVARLTAERLQSALKQNFVVENVSGAGGTAGPERVAKATPDGYTLMSTPIFQLTTAKYAQNVSFDENTFKPISGVASAPFAITVNASFPGKTLADFIAHVKANPGQAELRLGRRGKHHACRRRHGAEGRRPRHGARAVSRGRARLHRSARGPHRDGRRLAGRAEAVSWSPASSRRLRLLDTKPSPFLPGVPLVTDTLKDCPPAVTYNGLLGPKGIPQEVVDTLSRELVAAGKSQEFKQRFSNVGPAAAADDVGRVREDLRRRCRGVERHHADARVEEE